MDASRGEHGRGVMQARGGPAGTSGAQGPQSGLAQPGGNAWDPLGGIGVSLGGFFAGVQSASDDLVRNTTDAWSATVGGTPARPAPRAPPGRAGTATVLVAQTGPPNGVAVDIPQSGRYDLRSPQEARLRPDPQDIPGLSRSGRRLNSGERGGASQQPEGQRIGRGLERHSSKKSRQRSRSRTGELRNSATATGTLHELTDWVDLVREDSITMTPVEEAALRDAHAMIREKMPPMKKLTWAEIKAGLKKIDLLNIDFQIIKREFQSYSTQIQIGTCFVLACFKVYSATMATMLAVFVPQTCPPTPAEPYSHLCTIQENFFGISTFNKIVLGVNFFCFASFIVCELVLFRREVWLIRNLVESPDEPAENLPKALKPYPKYITNLRQWNLRACHAALLFFGMMVVNCALSCHLVLVLRYAGLRTWTALLSNTLLLSYKTVNNANIAFRCWSFKESRAVSLYVEKLCLYNALEPKRENERRELFIKNPALRASTLSPV